MSNNNSQVHVLILNGSARQGSHTGALGLAIQNSLQAKGASVALINIVDIGLPLADPAHREPSIHPSPNVQKLGTEVTKAQAIILLSPIYHNSYSGMLKNALDNFAVKHFAGKVIALGSHGGNRSSQAVDHLRIVTRSLNAIAIPSQVCTEDSDYSTEGNKFVLTSKPILERIDRVADELIKLTRALS